MHSLCCIILFDDDYNDDDDDDDDDDNLVDLYHQLKNMVLKLRKRKDELY